MSLVENNSIVDKYNNYSEVVTCLYFCLLLGMIQNTLFYFQQTSNSSNIIIAIDRNHYSVVRHGIVFRDIAAVTGFPKIILSTRRRQYRYVLL